MAAEYSANTVQTVQPGGSVIFTESKYPCTMGYIFHRAETGVFRLANKFFRQNVINCWKRNTNYEVAFHANVAVPEGETAPADGISLAITIDGDIDPSSTMTSDVTVVGTFDNVGSDIIVSVPYMCSCVSVSVRNVSTIPIEVQNANIMFD